MPEPDIPVPLPLSELCAHSGPQQQQSELPLTTSASPSSVLPGLWKFVIQSLAVVGGEWLALCCDCFILKERASPLFAGRRLGDHRSNNQYGGKGNNNS